MENKKKSNLYFIHANGFLPDAYKPLFNTLNNDLNIHNFFLLDIFKSKNFKLKNWIAYHNSFIKSIKHEEIIGLGHSIGGNIILRSAISHPDKFKAIILLDPTLFVPKIIFFWKIFYYLNIQKKFHPWLESTLKRRMSYNDFDSIFNAYRKKNVFKKINDENLKIYINSLTQEKNNTLKIKYPKEHEYTIYKTGLLKDNYIWKNIYKIDIPCLIIRASDSNAFLENAANKVSKLNKKIAIKTLDDTTHLFPLEKPNTVSELINKFLEDII